MSKFEITNTGNARATNLILTFQAPSDITIKRIFSTENYSISSAAGDSTFSIVKLFLPRLSAGSGSIFSVESNINSHSIRDPANKDYSLFITSDQGSVKIVKPITTLKTETQQGPSPTDLIGFVGFTGLFLWIGSPAMIHVARYYRNPERRGSTKIAVIIICVIVGAILFVDLVGLRVIRF